jgi:hypothetical protein
MLRINKADQEQSDAQLPADFGYKLSDRERG